MLTPTPLPFLLDPINFETTAWAAICRRLISCRRRGVFRVHACEHFRVGRTRRRSHHVKQLCNLEALGVSTAITNSSLSAQPMRVARFKLPPLQHVSTSGPAVTNLTYTLTWQHEDACSASSPCTPLAAYGELQLVYVGACVHLAAI
jgi:hypothetical protein